MESKFDGRLIQRIGWTLLGGLVTLVTLGILYPVALTWKHKWKISHTIVEGKRLAFDGNGFQLIGKWVLWMLLSVITIGIYALWIPIKLEQWKAKHTHFAAY